MMLYIGQSSAMTFYPLLLQNAGGTSTDLGLALGLMAISEFPFMFLSYKLLEKFRDTALLVFSMVFFAVRIFLFFAFSGSMTGLVWAQLSNSISFGIFLPTSVHYISRITAEHSKGTALSFASSMYMGAGGIIGSALGGIIIDAYGVRALFGWASLVAAVAAVIFAVAQIFLRRNSARPASAGRL
jgi:PPP family 3-phenylpropionic acid transporter